jgi:hypothetical protein
VSVVRRGSSTKAFLLGGATAVGVGDDLTARFCCLGRLGCSSISCLSLKLETFAGPLSTVDRRCGRLPLGCSDWSTKGLERFCWADGLELTFDHEGLFLKGDLLMSTLPSGPLTSFFDLIVCVVWLAGVSCLGKEEDAFE